MKAESNIKPKKYKIEPKSEKINEISFFTNVEEKIKKVEEQEEKVYTFDLFSIDIDNRIALDLEDAEIYNKWLNFAKEKEYLELASKIRIKRDKLLADTDKEMCFDRLNLEIPENLNAANLLTCVKTFFKAIYAIKNSKISKYRQELRDITLQKGFPYDVKFPKNESEDVK